MMKKITLILISFLTILLFFIGPAQADLVVPDRPSNGIYDPNHYLSGVVSDKLQELNSKSEVQIGIYIVESLNGESLEELSNTIARSWKIGYSDSNKGALLLIAIKDRKFRIETSNNLSITLTDTKAKKILDASRDKMRAKDYDGAVIDIIQNISNQEYKLAGAPVVERNYLLEIAKVLWDTPIGIILLCGGYFIISYLINLFKNGTVSERKRKSNKSYKGNDKLFPYDAAFINDGSWSKKALRDFRSKNRDKYPEENSSDSSSSWSSDDWSGGGFDGGGSSSDW
ncbi:TPM domain-containing protein [Streptococcus oralis]|uniref:TPM domain-containing protein n=1 Tax=Streptococcus oralis TaxID=1303 RepID=UPI001CC12FC5|nr:TPM domain-containing protein [Streptococcus oralis]MBZ2096746.1 TPM domain-containing protein [Streptococcus oralis]MBZ2102306.1 TPM domain-containing protein [Streptococcus oralis]